MAISFPSRTAAPTPHLGVFMGANGVKAILGLILAIKRKRKYLLAMALKSINVYAFLPPANEVWGKVIFSVQKRVSRILSTGGGDVHGCRGACVVARGACGVAEGACMVVGGHAWLWGEGACVGYDEIRSMSGWYASY